MLDGPLDEIGRPLRYRGALSPRASRTRAGPPSALDAEPLAVRERVRQPLRQCRLYSPEGGTVIPGCHRLSLTSSAVILRSALSFYSAVDCRRLPSTATP